ncbi:hypothetical protein F9L33_12930 [Amylibacter sp. SFDW26]|uniref:hypothetical protein n=1 Tax=Amylibacter sp. SFDW26 TaxID=2652722 RepID=UPI001261676C|nr:hypothetical protein [Amylibacter sp. SFDW26]KAB7613491.1 hypothetical protein F9L33_12930 [Amylibacter sp. SFDW26]
MAATSSPFSQMYSANMAPVSPRYSAILFPSRSWTACTTISLGVAAQYGADNYKGVFAGSNAPRQDTTGSISVTALFPNLKVYGFAPQLYKSSFVLPP